jgi:hypothetical protein
MKSNEIYFETLGAAVTAFVAHTFAKGGVLVENEVAGVAEKFNGGVSYGQTVSRSFELLSFKGKPTRKFAHITLYRMESGRYELTSYIL